MIKYECDKCGIILPKNRVVFIKDFPVRERIAVKDGRGAIIHSMERFDSKEVHLCGDCACKLATFLDVQEGEE